MSGLPPPFEQEDPDFSYPGLIVAEALRRVRERELVPLALVCHPSRADLFGIYALVYGLELVLEEHRSPAELVVKWEGEAPDLGEDEDEDEDESWPPGYVPK